MTCALRSKPGPLDWKNSGQRNALCTSCAAQPRTITNSVKRKTSVGRPGDRQSWHGASAACTRRQMRRKADSANRWNLYDSTAHPAWPNGRPGFQSLLKTSTMAWSFFQCFQGTGRGRQHASPHAHLARCTERIGSAREAPTSVSPCDGDLTRRQPRRVMPEDDNQCADGTRFEQHGRHRCLCNKISLFHIPSQPSGFSQFSVSEWLQSRSQQFLDGFNNATRISDVLLHAAACRMARNTHCYGTCLRCEYMLVSGMIRV